MKAWGGQCEDGEHGNDDEEEVQDRTRVRRRVRDICMHLHGLSSLSCFGLLLASLCSVLGCLLCFPWVLFASVDSE